MTTMRPAREIRAMRDRLQCRLLTGKEQVAPTLAPLEWVCDPLVSDRQLLDQIPEHDEDDLDFDVRRTLVDLADIKETPELTDVKELLRCAATDYVTDLAKSARRIDRLCKAELKERSKNA